MINNNAYTLILPPPPPDPLPIARCYQRSYKYAGLTIKKRCVCGQSINVTEEATNLKTRLCSKPCTGNATQFCGNTGRLDVLTTGLP